MKAFVYIVLCLFVLLVAYVVLNAYFYDRQTELAEPTNESSALAAYFEERMITRGIEDVGQPIEGFDANLLVMAYPGLEPEDFVGVAAFEGHYEVKNGEIAFLRDQETPMSSAARTVTEDGYAALLHNVAARLDVSIESKAAVDNLINAIDTGERIETRIDQGASALDVRVIPHEVLEDSRCPVDVTCVQAGTVRVRATLQSGLGTADEVFILNEPITTEAETVTLVRVVPERTEGEELDPGAYTFTFLVTKREDI